MSNVPSPRKAARISEALQRQIDMYTLVASAAGVSVLALAGSSEAKVVYTKTHQEIRSRVPLYIDLNHDGIKDFVLRTTYYAGSSYFKAGINASSAYHQVKNAVAGKRASRTSYFFSAASALPAGALIGAKRKFPVHRPVMAAELFQRGAASSKYFDVGPWVGKDKAGVRNRYLGFKFVVDGKVHYGWARVSVTLGHRRQYDDVSGTLSGYAYETVPDKPLIAGKTKGADVMLRPDSLGGLARGKK